jgi:hypothetical protein
MTASPTSLLAARDRANQQEGSSHGGHDEHPLTRRSARQLISVAGHRPGDQRLHLDHVIPIFEIRHKRA